MICRWKASADGSSESEKSVKSIQKGTEVW